MLRAAEIDDLLERHRVRARRSLGQNFVADPATVERIAALAGVGAGDPVVEIGPGVGSLTLALADTGAQVLAIEKDRSLLSVLAEVLESHGAPDVAVSEGDALTLDWSEVLGDRPGAEDREWTLVANLPYNVAVPVILEVLAHAPMVTTMVVMVQHEVAVRLAATAGDRAIGIPSIKVAWYARAELLDVVPPEVFVPRPKVTSALVRLTRRPPPSTVVDPEDVFALVQLAYRQRRKMLRSTLGRRVTPEVFADAQIDPTDRPERLGVADWTRLAAALDAVGGSVEASRGSIGSG